MVQRSARALAFVACIALAIPGGALGLPRLPFGGPKAGAWSPLKPGEWPQAHSDLPPDPAIRFGALPNGMCYAIMRNATPPGQVSLRFRIAAGSLMETDAQAGLAHFLEHLAFDGSKAVPNGEMVKILQRDGLAFGADTNAATSFDNTTFRLDLPTADDHALADALMLLRQTAGDLTLSPEAVGQERGVVLSEERTRDGPSYRIFKSRFGFLLDGQRPPLRYPIGKVEVIQKAGRGPIADFYARWYRPERATLIVVGDVDPDAMEARIKASFADWRGAGPAGADPDLGKVAPRGLQTRLAVEPGAPTSVQLSWVTPPDLAADDTARRRRETVEGLGFAVLNRRLAALARGEAPPFLSAAAFRVDQMHAARVTSLFVGAEPDRWQAALAAADAEQRRAVRFGVRPEELAREIAEREALLKQAAAEAATRQTPTLAAELEGDVGERLVATTPAETLALFEAAVKDITPEQVSAALKEAFSGAGPLVFVSSPTPIVGGEPAVQAAYVADAATDVAAPTALAQTSWPYLDFGDPGKVLEQREITDLDAVFVRFANGVKLTVKPTKFRDDQVMVKVRVGGGLRALSPNDQSLSWAGRAFIEGGLKKIDATDTERALAPVVYGANYQIEDDAFALSGATRRDDLDTQLQVLAAYVEEPGWRPEAFGRIQAYAGTLLDQFDHTDSGVLGRDLAGLMHGGDRRWTWPDRKQIAAASLVDLKRQMDPITTGPIEVVMVGDITVEKAIAAVAATFGALPARAAAAPAAGVPGFPAPSPTPVILTHAGRADQAIALAAWRTDDAFADPKQTRVVEVLGKVLQLRLNAVLRKTEALTYSPQVADHESMVWPHWGYMSASVETPPARLGGVFNDIAAICADLRDHDVGPDELARAKTPQLDLMQRARQTNAWWLAALSGAQDDPRRLASIRSEIALTERVTAADIRAAANRYLGAGEMWKLEVKPAGT